MKLKSNSKEMKTIVETFIIEETKELIYDNKKLDKWNNLVAKLELKGQTEIVKPNKSPVPFMHLKTSLQNVFSTLCPRKVDVTEYNITPIPIEILDLIALSKKEDYFSKIQIWYDEKTPDPVCIGIIYNYIIHKKDTYSQMPNTPKFRTEEETEQYIKKHNLNGTAYNWENKYYILGKWADVKYSFKELKEMATNRYISEQGASYRSTIKTYQSYLSDLENQAFERFGIDNISKNENLPF